VNAPLAIAEGFRNTPRLYGEEVPEHDPVTDWKSGFLVGGKEFAKGLSTGIADLVVQPTQGAKKNGVRGFLTGVGKGTIGTASKLGSAVMSLYAYPAQGLSMSIQDATHTTTRKAILSARKVHDLRFAERDQIDEAEILKAFDVLMPPKPAKQKK